MPDGFRDPDDVIGRVGSTPEELLAGFRPIPAPEEFEGHVARRLELLQRSDLAQLRMTVARRVGLPYSEVMDRWSLEDLAAELAWDLIEAGKHWDRCPGCGTVRGDVLDPDSFMPLDNGRWKLYLDTCHVCGELERANKDLEAESGVAPGTRWRLMPRADGDPWRDDGDVLGGD
jgi:rubredoxin